MALYISYVILLWETEVPSSSHFQRRTQHCVFLQRFFQLKSYSILRVYPKKKKKSTRDFFSAINAIK